MRITAFFPDRPPGDYTRRRKTEPDSRSAAEYLRRFASNSDGARCQYCGGKNATTSPVMCWSCAHEYPEKVWPERGEAGWYVAIPGRPSLLGPWTLPEGAFEEAEASGGTVHDFTDEKRIRDIEQALDLGGSEEVTRAINAFLKLRRSLNENRKRISVAVPQGR